MQKLLVINLSHQIRCVFAICIVATLVLAVGNPARAVEYYWDQNAGGAGTGGTGTWDTGSSLWRNGSTAGALGTWPNGTPSSSVAVFGGTVGTVTLSGTLNAAGITFGVGGYTLTGGTLNLAPNSVPFVYTTNGGTSIIDSTITSAGGTSVTKTGAGTLQINTGGGGASGSPNFYTVTGGTFNSSTGIFDSILAMPAGNRLGIQAGSPTTVLTLDAGTFQVTSATGNALAVNRRVQVNAAGGSIADFGSGNFYEPAIINNAGVSSSLYLSNISGTTDFRGVISGTGSVTWMGAGTANFTASNTYSGNTIVNGGILAFSGSGSVYNNGANAGSIIINTGGTVRIDRQDLFGGHTSVPTATITVNSGGSLLGNGFYNTLNNLSLNGGTLQTANGDAFWGSFALKGTVTVGGSSASTISSGGSTNNYIRIGTNTAGGVTTFNVADSTGNTNTDLTISAQLRDNKESGSPFNDVAGGLTKTGAGTLTLSGANTFTGAVTVSNGTLVVGTAAANDGSTGALGLGTGGKTITVSAGATLAGTAQNWFGNQANVGTLPTITVNGGTLSTSRYTTIGALTLNGATMTNTATDTGNYQAFAFRGNVAVGGSSASTISANAATATAQGYHLGSNTTFTVADATGNANTDLLISAPLRDQSGDFGNAAGAFTKSGAGTLTLSGANTYTGGTTISTGAISVGEPGSSGTNGTNTSLGSGSVNVTSGAQLIFAGKNLNIANNVTLNGAATVNSLQGALVGGRQDGDNNNTLSGILTLAGTGDRTVSTWWSDKRLTLSGKVTGTGNLRIVNATNGGNGGSIVILSNATNDYSGNTIVDGGGNGSTQTLRLGADNVIPDGAGKGNLFIEGRLELNGFNEIVNGLSTGGGVISLSSGNTLTIGNNDAGGDSFVVLTGLGNLTKIGNGTQILRGTSDFSGTTTISGGTLQVSVNGTTASLGSGNIVNNATLAFQRQNEITVNNAISGTGAVSQIGTGTLVLAGTNKTYTGATNVNSGTVRLTGTLANTAIAVASGATFNPSVTTSAGLTSGSAGASLALNSGAIYDMTSAGTINTFTLNPGSNTFAGQALSLAGTNLRFDLGSSSADQLQVNSGTAAVSGTNNVRFSTGSSLTTGTYTLIGSAAGGLTGSFQFDGGSTLGVPAQQQIKQVGGNYYRLTLQNSSTAEQVVVAAAPSNVINIMPVGSSITEGVSSEGATYNGGGYRSQLYQSLVNDGRFTPHFVGSSTVLDASNSTGYNVLTGANELNHEGHSGYTTSQILKNLNANGGDGGNNGGFWLAPGNGKNPDYVTLSIGGNDYGANGAETTGPLNRTDAIVSQIASLRSDAQIIVSNLFYRTQTAGGNVVGDLQNTYYNPGVPEMVFNHVLAGHHVSFNDAYSAVTPGNNMSTINDGIHPNTTGYNAFANSWYDALANGSAFWTGSSGGTWNNQTNFAQNYQGTTPRQTALSAATDVHFNSNAAPLATTLGANTSVRSVNFAAGATGAVSVGGNTLTVGEGGITVQAGTGAHTISSDVVLGTNQTWGNVSSNPFTVSGVVSGSPGLTVVGSYTVQLPGTLSGSIYTTTTQTVSGTGAIVLTAANTYTGATTISSGTLQLGNGGTTGSLNSASQITNNGTLSFNRSNTLTQGTDFDAAFGGTGAVVQAGIGTTILNGPNTYTGTTTISAGTLLANTAVSGSNSATGTSDVNVNATGTLGGIGQIGPGTGNNITVLSGGTLAPGASIGTLTLNGTGTAVNLLTMNSGSGFDFELGLPGGSFAAPGSSDLLSITSAAAGDVVFNNNLIDVLSTGEVGFYKLFDSDLATAVAGSDTWSGLTLGGVSGREIVSGLTVTNLNPGRTGTLFLGDGTNGDAGDIYLQVVPEPSSLAMLLFGSFTFWLVGRKRSRRFKD